jgi:hypothetical protein
VRILIAAAPHRTELHDAERFAVAADPIGPVEDWSATVAQDREADDGEQGKHGEQEGCGDDYVERSLGSVIGGITKPVLER